MEKTAQKIDPVEIAGIIALDIASRLGHQVDATPSDVLERGKDIYFKMNLEQSFGIFAMVIKSAQISVHAAVCDDGSIWVKVDLDYAHPSGGTNGSSIGTYWMRDGQIENFREN